MPSRDSAKDTAREFFILAHAVIANEMSVRAIQRLRVEPEDSDPLHFWFAWQAEHDFESQTATRVPGSA
jgi:hypothetical protein